MCPAPISRLSLIVCHALLLALPALPAAASPFADAVAEVRSYVRLHPSRALERLEGMQRDALLAPPDERGEYMVQVGYGQLHSGLHDDAAATAERLLLLADIAGSHALRIKGMLLQANVLAADNQRERAHQLFWNAHQLASSAAELPLRLQADIAAGQAYAEAGRYQEALQLLLTAADSARHGAGADLTISALQTLADLYETMHDYPRGLAAVDEALALATRTGKDAQLAILRITEFNLASASHDGRRAIAALRSALTWAHAHEVDEVAAVAQANLADTYLEMNQPERALRHAGDALRLASFMGDDRVASAARMSMGRASLMLGRIEVGKRYLERAIAYVALSQDKPALLADLDEYGKALELAGDAAGALQVLRRARAIADELNEDKRSGAVAEVQERYETSKRRAELAELQRQSRARELELYNQHRRQLVVATLAAVALAAAILMAVLLVRLRRAHLQLRQLSIRDPLTSLYNRRHFQELMRTTLRGVSATQDRSAEVGLLIVLDVDHFKRVNDDYGHAAGDLVLKTVAQCLRQSLRETDIIVRWGGEEFLAYIEALPRADVDDVARRVLAGVARTAADYQGTRIAVTVSVGFAQVPLSSPDGLPLERVIALADQALYLAKHSGRNRACGLRTVAAGDPATLDHIEHHMQEAARAGLVDLVALTA